MCWGERAGPWDQGHACFEASLREAPQHGEVGYLGECSSVAILRCPVDDRASKDATAARPSPIGQADSVGAEDVDLAGTVAPFDDSLDALKAPPLSGEEIGEIEAVLG